jgi:hypothetical protein
MGAVGLAALDAGARPSGGRRRHHGSSIEATRVARVCKSAVLGSPGS